MDELQAKTLVRLNSLVVRIDSGKFNADDVDSLLMLLRPYAESRYVFREVCDFVAHPAARDRGKARNSIEVVADSFKFYFTYQQPGRPPFDMRSPFPAFMLRLFRSQTILADEKRLLCEFKVSRKTLLAKIDNHFALNNKTNLCALRKPKIGKDLVDALKYLVSFIAIKPAFDMAEFFDEFFDLLQQCGVRHDRASLSTQLDRITLAIMCNISGAKVGLSDNDRALCIIGTESEYRMLAGQRRTEQGAVTELPAEFGSLQIYAVITPVPTETFTIRFPLIRTSLRPKEHCEKDLFDIRIGKNEFGNFRHEFISLKDQMSLTAAFKLTPSEKHLS